MSSIRKGVLWQLVLVASVFLLALAGCQPGQQAAAPTEAAASVPAEADAGAPPIEEAYPAVDESYPAPGEPAADAYPAPAGDESGPVPGLVPARPNGSKVTAELISAQPDEARPGYIRLRVKLLASAALEGQDSVTDDLVDQEVELLIDSAQMPDLKPGDTFEAEVSFLGDERGADYYILKLLKMPN